MDAIAEDLERQEQRILRTTPQLHTSAYYSRFGDYNIDVITRSLEIANIRLLILNSRENPPDATAYVIHCADHWIAIVKLKIDWWNLDSLKTPKKIKNFNLDQYVSLIERERKGKAVIYYVNNSVSYNSKKQLFTKIIFYDNWLKINQK